MNSEPTRDRRYYISKLISLAGMLLTAYFIAPLFGMLLCKPLFGIDAIGNPYTLATYAGDANKLNALKFIQLVSSLGLFFFCSFLFSKMIGEKDSLAFFRLKTASSPRFYLLSILLFFAANPWFTELVLWNEALQLPDSLYWLEQMMKTAEQGAAEITAAMLEDKSMFNLSINLLIIALLPALGEELLFRGVIQQFLQRWTRNIHWSVWTTAAVFSAIHLQFYGFLPRMAMGALLGYCFYWSGSLWLAMLLHFLNNATIIIIKHLDLDKNAGSVFAEDYQYSWFILLGSIILSILLFQYLQKNRKTTNNGTELEQHIQHP